MVDVCHGTRVRTMVPWYTCTRVEYHTDTRQPMVHLRTGVRARVHTYSQNTRGSQCTCVPFSNQKVVTQQFKYVRTDVHVYHWYVHEL
jgi:hypothetical protein